VTTIEAVYRHYDQKGLDAQYNNRARFPNYIEHFKAWQRWSETTRSRLHALNDVAFGVSAAEKLDIFPGEEQGAPIYVFIHGGYCSNSKSRL